MYMAGFLGSIGPGPYGAINNPQNNPILVAVVNALNSASSKPGTVNQTHTVPVEGPSGSGTTFQNQTIQHPGIVDSAGNTIPGAEGAYVNPVPGNPGIYTFTFPDNGSRGTVYLFAVTGPDGHFMPIKDPNLQVKWQPGSPGGWLTGLLTGLGPILKIVGPILALYTLGTALAASMATSGAAASASSAASAATAAGSSAVDYSLAAGMGPGIGLTIPAAIAAPVSSLADITLGQGLVAAGTVLPSIGAGALGAGITIPASIAAPVSSLSQIAAGTGLVAAPAGTVPAVSSPIPSKVITPTGPTAPIGIPSVTQITQAVGATTGAVKAITGATGGGSTGGGGGDVVSVQRSPGMVLAPPTSSPILMPPVPTGLLPQPLPQQAPGSVNNSLRLPLASGGMGMLLFGAAALFFLMKKGR